MLLSCSKERLELLPTTNITDVNAFVNKDRIISQVNGLYAGVKSGNYRGGRFLVYNDVRAENFINRTSNGVTGYLIWNHTETADENNVTNLWNAAYAAVNRINLFLEGLEKADPVASGVLSSNEFNQFKGEALALRGLIYFDLVTTYSKPFNINSGNTPGVPLRLIAYQDTSGNNMARSSVSEVYVNILSDFDQAESLVSADLGSDLLNTTRIHRNTVIALKTRVYLSMNNWAKVIEEAVKIVPQTTVPFSAVTGVQHALQSNIASVFAAPYTTKESIFSMPMTTTNLPGTQNSLASYYDPGPAGTGEYYLNAAGILGNSAWNNADARKNAFTLLSGGRTYLNKFPTGPTQTDYAPVIRYSEVLLNYAEAESRLHGVSELSINLLNAVRGRSFPGGTYTTGSFSGSTNLIDAIMVERNIEFLGEGIRNLDLMRTVSTIPAKGSVISIPSTDLRYVFPIPTSELIINKLCVQNQ